MKKSIPLLCIIILVSLNYLQGQKRIAVLYQPVINDETHVIGYQGDLLFTLPSNHTPYFYHRYKFTTPFSGKHFKVFNFGSGPLPVYSKGAWYLYNYHGEVVKKLGGNYQYVTPAIEGFHRAYEHKYGDDYPYKFVYLNTKGERLFDGKRFYKATKFKDGFAIVREKKRNSAAYIINSKGEKVADFPSSIASFISYANPFSDSLSLITLQHPKGYDRNSYVTMYKLYNIAGEEITEISKLSNLKKSNLSKFKNGMAYYYDYHNHYFINKSGEVLHKLGNGKVVKFTENHILFEPPDGNRLLYNRNFEPITLEDYNDTSNNILFINSNHIAVESTDDDSNYYHLYDISSLNKIYTTEHFISKTFEDRVILLKKDGSSNSFYRIEDTNHNIIFERSPENIFYQSTSKAIPFKNKVKYLTISSDSELKDLTQFKNLEVLKIVDVKARNLSENIHVLKQLRSLQVRHCHNLLQLPNTIEKLPKLEYLEIISCKNITGLEAIISKMPQLKKVRTSGYHFTDGFVEKIEADRPYLKIFNLVGTGFRHKTVQKEELNEEKAPPPLRQKKHE